MIRVLFVDDDPLILAGIKRLMRRMADQLQPEFASSGPEALKRLDEQPFDAIVSDMRMPNMDGAELLSRVRSKHPDVIRLILSGQSPNESKFRALGPAHQSLTLSNYTDYKRELQELFHMRIVYVMPDL